MNEMETGGVVDRKQLWWIIAGAVALRLIWAAFVPVVPISDSIAYDAFARTLAEHQVFGWTKDQPFAFWPPGTSFLHALVYAIFGHSHSAIVGFNILVSAGLILTSVRVSEKLFDAGVAFWTAVILAAWPTLIMYCTVLASELPYVLMTVLALDIWLTKRPMWLRVIGAGALLGLAAVIRPLSLLLPAVYAASIAWQHRFERKALFEQARVGLLATLVMLAVISPWTYRNYQLYGEPVLISTNGGITLWMGNTPGTDGSYMRIPADISKLPDNEQARVLGAQAREYILNDPIAFAARSARKLYLLYGNESIGVLWNTDGIRHAFGDGALAPLKRVTQVSWLAILLMAAIGFFALCRDRGFFAALFSPIVLTIVFHSAVYIITVAQDRYHLSFAAQIAIMSAAGVHALMTWRSGSQVAYRAD